MNIERTKKNFSIATIAIFIIIIATPLIFINRNTEKISTLENKKLAAFPSMFATNGGFSKSFFSDFETYINDNIGFKQETVVFDIATEYKLFNKLKIPNYIMGKDKNLFYTTNGVDILNYQGKNKLSESSLNELSQGYSYMQKYFENTGASFYMMTIPNKEGVYPELYPKEVLQHSTKSRIDLLTEFIQRNTNINILNVKQALINSKGKDMLYYKNYDCTHWNMNGAFVGYTEIMKEIMKKYPNLDLLKKDDFIVTSEKSKGSLQHLSNIQIINNAMKFDDDIYTYTLKLGYQARLSEKLPEGLELDANDKCFYYINKNKSGMPKIIIVGDSYIYSFLLPIFAESFSELYFINFKSAQELMYLQDKVNADIVLYEFVERAFNDQIYGELSNFRDTTVENTDFTKLPIISDSAEFHIDIPALVNNSITVDQKQMKQDIYGWAIDIKAKDLLGDLYLQVGDKYYKSQSFDRPDLKDEKYLKAGFKFMVPTKELIKAKNIRFFMISNDKTYQYKPVDVLIK